MRLTLTTDNGGVLEVWLVHNGTAQATSTDSYDLSSYSVRAGLAAEISAEVCRQQAHEEDVR